MDRFMAAYEKWPPTNQMVLVLAAGIMGTVFLFLFGWWLRQALEQVIFYVAVMIRGWPHDDHWTEVALPTPLSLPPPRILEPLNGTVREVARTDVGDRDDEGAVRRVRVRSSPVVADPPDI